MLFFRLREGIAVFATTMLADFKAQTFDIEWNLKQIR